jgi:hypothetical protein
VKVLTLSVCLVCSAFQVALAAAPAPDPPQGVVLLHARWPYRPLTVKALTNRIRPTAPIRDVESVRHPYVEATSPLRLAVPLSVAGRSRTAFDVSDARPQVTASALPSSFVAFEAAHDPAIAVGHHYILVISDHHIAFYGRDGRLLPSKNGELTDMSAAEFFRAFWEPTRPDGTANTTNINAHLHFPPGTLSVDLLKDPVGQKGAISSFYDSRCFYDPVNRRFFFLSAARNPLWFNDPTSNPNGVYDACVRRFFAFAVSKTEDPRDGFEQWITTESNYADWPRMAVANGFMTVAHNSPQAGKPFAYVFKEADLLVGAATPVNWHYSAADFPGVAKVLPVTQYGDSGGITYFAGVTKPQWNPIKVFGFLAPASPGAIPPLLEADLAINPPMDYQIDNPKYRDGYLYFCCNNAIVEGRLHVRVTRFPIGYRKGQITAFVTSGPGGFLDYSFGRNGPGDAPTDLVSYERPALTVNKNGVCAIVYGRIGVKTAQPLYPEVRYSLLYHLDAFPRPSALVHKGEFSTEGPIAALDLANAVVDPVDDLTLWVCHGYADKSLGRYRIVVARVTPAP